MSADTDDISIEPLFNQSSEGTGANKKIAFVPVNTVAVASNRAANTINSTREEITITAGNRTIELHNSGTKKIYYGGSGVDENDGIPLLPSQTKPFGNVQDSFSVWVVCAAGESSTLRVVEYT